MSFRRMTKGCSRIAGRAAARPARAARSRGGRRAPDHAPCPESAPAAPPECGAPCRARRPAAPRGRRRRARPAWGSGCAPARPRGGRRPGWRPAGAWWRRRVANGAVFRYEPRAQKFDVYVSHGFANPHGHVFDKWGEDIVVDGTGAVPYHGALFSGHVNYPEKHSRPPQVYQQRTRPCAGPSRRPPCPSTGGATG